MLQAGTARRDMTPEVGVLIAGAWRPRKAESIETPLHAHALVLDDGTTQLAIVALDLIAIRAKEADRAKAQIERATGIPPEHVLITCSHTHEAPYPAPLLGADTGPDPRYMARVVRAIADAVNEAAASMQPAEIGHGATLIRGVCNNRRRLKAPGDAWNAWMLPPEERDAHPPAGPIDEALTLLAVRTPGGDPIALVWNFALHAHAFNGRYICADYPYYVWQDVARELGADVTSLYLPGACGDINRRHDADPPMIVSRLSHGLLELYGKMAFRGDVPLAASMESIVVRRRQARAGEADEVARKLPAALPVWEGEQAVLPKPSTRPVRTTLQVVAVGDVAVAAVPGEYFCALGLDIKRNSPFGRTVVAELSNDYVGYIPTAGAYDEGGYELFTVQSSYVERGTGERMVDALVRMLCRVHKQEPVSQA